MNDRISREELVKIYDIEISFFVSLEEFGLLNPQKENDITYLLYDDLPAFEKFTNWHYDLEINLPGLEVIHELLKKLETLQNDNRRLSRFSYNQEEI